MSQTSWNKKLLNAVENGELHEIEKCIENGADLNHLDGSGDTLLSNAAYYGPLNIVQYFVLLGADLNKITISNRKTPLSWALHHGHVDIATYLAHRGAQLTILDHNPLICAVITGQTEAVQYLLQSKVEINNSKESGLTALNWAALLGYLDIVKLLVEAGADINYVNKKNKTSITYALEADNLDVVEYLIAKGCQVPWPEESEESRRIKTLLSSLNIIHQLISLDSDLDDSNSPTARCLSSAIKSEDFATLKYLSGKGVNVSKASLLEAVRTGNLEITEFLLSKGCKVNQIDSDGNTPLTNAVKSKNINMVRVLVNAGSDVCKVGQSGRTPLSVAAELQNLDLVKLLLDKGASPTIQTVFIEAIQAGNRQIVEYLQQKGASVNFMYEDGGTPLTKAIQTGHLKIAEFLYEEGANPEVIINDVTNLHLMNYVTNGNIDMVNFLVELGVKLEVVGADGSTPLTKAIKIENFQLVKYFIEKGANVNGVDGNNKTPLAVAAENCYFSIVKFLIEFGANIELAKSELTAYCSWNKDLAIYLKVMNKEISNTVNVLGSGHDGSDLLETKVEEEK
ncbi:hypothetical protein Zmor_018447 [Zophobas morio]|uniref:Ankyrin repeat protein n=1 Tax=Zophobas morio TaxID=2755281 RepID=A0AA38IAL9_9CUCU|nr:hypothetical protein Zmor_018447 [Zophobas morio]